MAADEALLDAAAAGTPGGRWYRWSEPTVSLGHFQKPDRLAASGFGRLPRVRRLSGGGAIVHDDEWTYAMAVPRGHRLARTPETFYEAVHEELIAALATVGVEARLRGHGGRRLPPGSRPEPTLCFMRSDPRDIVVRSEERGWVKVVGSAQRRRRGAVLQHGSLLASASPEAIGVPGLRELCGSDGDAVDAAVRDAAARLGRLLRPDAV